MPRNCTACGGMDRRRCSTCGGSGEKVLDRKTDWTIDCPDCDGRTYLEEDSCSECGGSGTVEDEGYPTLTVSDTHKGPFATRSDWSASQDSYSVAGTYFPRTGPRADEPVLPAEWELKAAIVSNSPGVFEVQENPGAQPRPVLLQGTPEHEEVTRNEELIVAAAQRFGVDPDLVRTTIWYETIHGPRDGNPRVSNDETKPVPPMNIPVGWWADLGVTEASLQDPKANIDAGVFLMSQLQERLVRPTPEKLFSIYNNAEAQVVSTQGTTAAWYLEHRPWLWSAAEKSRMYDRPAPGTEANMPPTSNGGGSGPGSLLSTIMGASPRNSRKENASSADAAAPTRQQRASDIAQEAARMQAEAWKNKAKNYVPPPPTVEERVLINTKKQAQAQAKSETKKEALNLMQGKGPLKRSTPKHAKPLKEYDNMKKRAADDQVPAVSNFSDAVMDLWRKAANALTGEHEPHEDRQKKPPTKPLGKY